MGFDRKVYGPPSITRTWGTDSPGAGIIDLTNGDLYFVGKSQMLHLAHKNSATQGPQNALTNITAAQTLFTVTPSAGSLNIISRMLRLRGWIVFSTTAANSSAITLVFTLGGVTIATLVTTATNAAALVGAPLTFELDILVTATGATGAVIAQGRADVQLGATVGAALTTFVVTSATPAAVNLTAANALAVTIAASGSGIPSAQLAMLTLEKLN